MEQLLYKIDDDGDGQISYQEFLKYFGKGGAEDKNVISKVRHERLWLPIRLAAYDREGLRKIARARSLSCVASFTLL